MASSVPKASLHPRSALGDEALVPVETALPATSVAAEVARLERARADVSRALVTVRTSLSELRHEVALRTDWRTYVRARPGTFLAAAFLVGFLLGSRHQPQHRVRR
jgi:hypothetical protein